MRTELVFGGGASAPRVLGPKPLGLAPGGCARDMEQVPQGQSVRGGGRARDLPGVLCGLLRAWIGIGITRLRVELGALEILTSLPGMCTIPADLKGGRECVTIAEKERSSS